MIRSLLVGLFLILYLPPACLGGLLLAWIFGSNGVLYRLGRLGVKSVLLLAGTRIEVEGRERLGDGRNIVLISNHSSHLDAPVLLQGLGVDFKAVAKTGVFQIPLLGWVLRQAGFVEVNRANLGRAHRALSRAAGILRSGSCLLVFPEGTRSPNGELGPFKKGGFVAAMEAGSRIVPVVVTGTRELMPRGAVRVRPGTARVRVLDPVDVGRYSYGDRDRLLADVRGRMAAALAG